MTTTTGTLVTVVCSSRPSGEALCLTMDIFGGTDRIDALTNARLAGWGVRVDDGRARCPGCKAAGVPFPRAAGSAQDDPAAVAALTPTEDRR